MRRKRLLLAAVLLMTALCLCGCKQNPTQEALFSKLIGHFSGYGFRCSLEPLEADRPAPIYNASVWQRLLLDGEEVLVYFDESNRADYLCGFVDPAEWGCVTRYGLRFVLVYSGQNAAVLQALDAIQN